MSTAEVRIVPAHKPEHVETVRALFREYERWTGVDLCFQGFEAELASLPGDYAPPQGRLLLATAGDAVAGCVALRALAADTAEMKRLFVREEYRGRGLGRRLATACIAAARDAGYVRLRLDTLPLMQAAIAMYVALGFREIPPYRPNPIPGALYMELLL